jgi:hypothetical protein
LRKRLRRLRVSGRLFGANKERCKPILMNCGLCESLGDNGRLVELEAKAEMYDRMEETCEK